MGSLNFRPLIFLSLLAGPIAWAQQGRIAWLDLEPGDRTQVYSEPGHVDIFSCAGQAPCEILAEPDRNSAVEITGPKVRREVTDPYTGEKRWEEFYPVRVVVPEERNGRLEINEAKGWIDAASLRFQKPSSTFYGASSSEKAKGDLEDCPPRDQATQPLDQDGIGRLIQDFSQDLETQNVNESAASLSEVVGFCAWDGQTRRPKPPPNVFDQIILSQLAQVPLPKGHVNEQGQPMTRAQLIEIAAMARTLYGEMGRCFKHGLHYPMAVAKVALNRQHQSSRDGEWIRDDHAQSKTRLTKILTSPSQFNVWMPTHQDKTNGAFRQAACPPSSTKKNDWRGVKPAESEVKVWEKAMKIATEAVLHPTRFKKRTSAVKALFYTSGLGRFRGLSQAKEISIEGRSLEKDQCLELWLE